MNCKVNCARVDFRPTPRVSDLDLAKARKNFDLKRNSSVIRRPLFTVKFTAALFIQVWFKKDIRAKKIRQNLKEIYYIYQRLNFIKNTKVTLASSGIINLQASGSYTKPIDFLSISKSILPTGYKLLASIALTEPFGLISRIDKGTLVRYIQVTADFSSHIRISKSGAFTIIARNVIEYKKLLTLAKTLFI